MDKNYVLSIIKNGYDADIIFVNGLPMESYVANIFLRKVNKEKLLATGRGKEQEIKELLKNHLMNYKITPIIFILKLQSFQEAGQQQKPI